MGDILTGEARERGRLVYDTLRGLASGDPRFIVKNGLIHLKVLGRITEEQRTIIRENRADLYAYLTTPPSIVGICRRGHLIKWQISEFGVWLCSCYWEHIH